MLRSLFSGVTGLSGNIVEMDVVGNNISNVNTVAFKSSRVTFQEILTQNLRPATRPASSGAVGGTNPQQIGLGTVVGSIDTNFSQGDLRTTGNKTDLALQGDGFFVLDDGQGLSFTRAGNFTFDADNSLVDAATGRHVQGLVANAEGQFVGAGIGNIVIDPSIVVPAEASSEVTIFGNLSSENDETGSGSHLELLDALMVVGGANDRLDEMFSSLTGEQMNIGAEIVLEGEIGGVPIPEGTAFKVNANASRVSIEDLRLWFEQKLLAEGAAAGTTVSFTPTGQFQINNPGGGAELTNIVLSNGGQFQFNEAMIFPDSIIGGSSGTSAGAFLAAAEEDDFMSDLYAGNGQPITYNFAGGATTLNIDGTLGGEGIASVPFAVTQGVTTVQELLDTLESTFRITNDEGVTLNEGVIDIQGDIGEINDIANLSLSEPGNALSNLDTAVTFRPLAAARDSDVYSVTSTVYDSLGTPHNLTLDFTKQTGVRVWDWVASFDSDEVITSGGSGVVSFDEYGSLQSFTFNDGSPTLRFNPQPTPEQGAASVELFLNLGDIGGTAGLTQFEPADKLGSFADGYTVGRLIDFDIDRDGVIAGRFSNDTILNLARISVARFTNEGGLTRTGNNAYANSGNSGQPIIGFATEGGMGEINSGAVEASNVDLSEQFTRLVVAQRAFQSNARVISTADEVLQELVNIV